MARSRPAPWLHWVGLVAAWAASRALLVAVGLRDFAFYPEGRLAFDDLDVYAGWLPTLGSGTLPTDDMWQYPPFSGLFFLYRDRGEGSRVVKALTLRISLSILLFIGLLLTYLFGRTMLS